jgi:hypothetical protein
LYSREKHKRKLSVFWYPSSVLERKTSMMGAFEVRYELIRIVLIFAKYFHPTETHPFIENVTVLAMKEDCVYLESKYIMQEIKHIQGSFFGHIIRIRKLW